MRPRVAVIGAGSWGINHVRVLATEPRFDLVAVAESDASKYGAIAALAPKARIVASAEAAIDDAGVDAVVIATPAASHVELALMSLAANKHVLIEKPLARSLADASRIADAARRSGRTAMVGHLMVYHPAVRRLRELLRSGALGRPYYIHATRVNLGRLRSDETALWCFGPHDLSMIDYIVGETPSTVSACGQAVLQPGVEDVAFVTLRFPSGLVANLHLSWLHPRKERRLTLVCSHKMVEFDDQEREKLRIYDKGYDRPPDFSEFGEFLTLRDGDVHIPHLPMEEPLRAELRHFLDCIVTGATPDTALENGAQIVAVLEAAERSLQAQGVPVDIPQMDSTTHGSFGPDRSSSSQ